MKSSSFILPALVLFMTACGSQDSVQSGDAAKENATSLPATAAIETNAAPAKTAEAVIAGAAGLNPEHGKPGHRCEIPVGAPLNAVAQPNLSAPITAPVTNNAAPAVNIPLNLKGLNSIGQPGGALNPEHGKPGHRCDIAVGAPLNSAAASAVAQPTAIPVSQPTASVQTPVINTVNTNNTSSAAAGLNPQHGQPGHRCDIAVGAPLNSKPGAAAAKASPQVTATPVVAAKPGMNPQHGQPGHRCDIAVGAPLNSKPTTATPPQPAEVKAVPDSGGK